MAEEDPNPCRRHGHPSSTREEPNACVRFSSRTRRRAAERLTDPEIAQRILQRLQKLSEPFGTKLTIEGGVGVIRLSPVAASAQR